MKISETILPFSCCPLVFPDLRLFLTSESIFSLVRLFPKNSLRRLFRVVTGKSLDSPENGNVDKMSEKCRKNVRKMSKNCPEGLKTQFPDIFWTFFAYLVDAFVW